MKLINFSFQKLLCPLIFLHFFQTTQAQFLQTIEANGSGPYTPQSLISNVFLGDGVEVTSINYNGSPRAVGYFSGGTQSIGIERGIILTSGYAAKPLIGSGPTDPGSAFDLNSNGSTATDANLTAIATAATRDVAVYTITFIPTSDTLRFRYCFASEEYPEYSCTLFNDIFGFFIQGPGYPVPTNIALIPGTNLPVAINNIHPTNTQNNPIPNPCLPFNSQYYNSNLGSMLQPVYDGFTDVFTAMAVVTPCQEYTIKLAIADVFDSAYDSGVFLEAKSFGTSGLRVAMDTPSADGSIAEGCTPATVSFTLGTPLTQNFPVNINTFGTAIPGVDFQQIPNNLVIPAGQTQISFPISAFEDNLIEPMEFIAFDVQIDACNRDTVYLYIRDNPIVPPLMQDTSICTPGAPVTLDATIPVPTPQPPTFTNSNSIAIPDNYPAVNSSINVVGVQPTFLGPGVIRSVCLDISHGYDDDLDIFLISPGGQVLELSTDNGGSGDNYTNTCFTASAPTTINFPGPQAPASAAPFSGEFQPEGPWGDLWDTPNRPVNGTWQLQIIDDFQSFTGTLNSWSITFAPTYEISYQWNNDPDINCLDCPSTMANPMVSNTYTVTATDIYGCTTTGDVTVDVLNFSASTNLLHDVSCYGGSDGSAEVTVNVGGTNNYQWDDPSLQTNLALTNVGAGTYQVTVSNAGGCTATATVDISEPALLELTTTSSDALCYGDPSGTATAEVNGGTQPYSYLWSTGNTTSVLASLGAGTFLLTVTDNNGCTAIEQVIISEPAEVRLNLTQAQNISCFSGSDGQISVTSTGGIDPVNYLWNTGTIGPDANSLPAGTYTVTITDANGCSSTLSQALTQPNELTGFATNIDVKCHGQNDGELHLDINGGSIPYNANWQGPGNFNSSGQDLTNLFAGNYMSTITDINGCTHVVSALVNEPDAILLDLPAVTDTICFNASNGTATVLPAGGVAPYQYLWSANNQNNQTATGLAAQQYTVTVTDANGCTKLGSTIVPQKAELNAFALPTLPNCHDGNDGTATVNSVYYGITPANLSDFTFLWNTTPTQSGITASQLSANQSYSVTLTDSDGCTATHSVVIGNPIAVEAGISGKDDVECHGEATGWAAAMATGGTAPYTWFWNQGTSVQDSVGQGLSAGLAQVTITDAHGCEDVVSVMIQEPTLLQGQITPVHVKCYGEFTGSAIVNGSGGVSPYSYSWGNGEQGNSIQDVASGSYPVSITDKNGCVTTKIAQILQPDAPLDATLDMIEPRCHGDQNGQIIFHPMGGTAPYRYALDNGPYSGSAVRIGLSAGFYEATIMDINGCIAELPPIEVTQKDPMDVDLGPDFHIILGQDTQLVAQVFNYNSSFNLVWSPQDSVWLSCMSCTNPSVYNLEYSEYFEVTAIDSLGCRASDMVYIQVDKPRKVFVPTAFSPNGDFINDLLLVHGQKTSKALLFRVFDRWGEMVYEAKNFAFNDENTGWDGTFRGQEMDPGVYIWILEVEYVDGATEVYKGNTTLIR